MISYWHTNYLQRDMHRFWLYLVLASASALRLILIVLGWPITNSDEATMGLMAMHIVSRGEYPIFFYGQNYMGSLEAYLAAPLFRLIGPSAFSLRFGLVIIFILFLWLLYRLIGLLYTKNYALLAITLLCFGSAEMLTRQLKAVGGDMETLLFGTLMLLLATHLALSFYVNQSMKKHSYARSFLYLLLGCAMGAGIWSHMLVLPFVGVSLLLLFLFCRSEWRTKSTLFLVLGLLIGLFPLLLFNVEHPLQNSLGTLWQLHNSGGTAEVKHVAPWDSLLGAVIISIPEATGAPYICQLSSSPGAWSGQLSSCVVGQSLWGIGFLLLGLLAGWLTIKRLRETRRSLATPRTFAEQRSLIIYTARLMVLVGAGLTLLAFIVSPAPALVPATAARYLVGLLIAFPVVLAPLWEPLRSNLSAARIHKLLLLKRTGILIVGVLLLASTLSVFQQVPTVQAVNRQQEVFIADLLRVHATHIYSDYWTCDNVIFQSHERVICSVLDENLQAGEDRYLPYRAIVQQDKQATYVFPIGSLQAQQFLQQVESLKKPYPSLMMDGYVVYQYVE